MQRIRKAGAWMALSALVAITVLGVPATAFGAASEEKVSRVNVNTASADELATLPGIGPSYAKRIVDYREKNGPFKRVEDLLNVQGIGEKTLEKIRDKVVASSGK